MNGRFVKIYVILMDDVYGRCVFLFLICCVSLSLWSSNSVPLYYIYIVTEVIRVNT